MDNEEQAPTHEAEQSEQDDESVANLDESTPAPRAPRHAMEDPTLVESHITLQLVEFLA